MPRRGGRHFVILSGAEDAMTRFKMEIAEDMGLSEAITQEGWESLSTKDVGRIGGEMVRRIMLSGEQAILDRYNNNQPLSPDWDIDKARPRHSESRPSKTH